MASYKVIFKPSVEKDLRSLPKSALDRVLKRIEALKQDPFPPQATKLTGTWATHRVRVGDYRVIYGVDKKKNQIIIHHVRHRREVYKHL